MIRAYSCHLNETNCRLVVFASDWHRATVLAVLYAKYFQFIHWKTRRLPAADGLSSEEAVWLCADDAPEHVRSVAATLWRLNEP